MGLGILEDKHLDHVPGTALLADMLDTEHHQFHGRQCTLSDLDLYSSLPRPRHIWTQAR